METTPERLLVIGATGGIGRALLEQAVARGHRVTALVRSPDKLRDRGDAVTVVAGDPLDPETVKSVLPDHDAVLSALGPPGIRRSTVQEDGARATVEAMTALGVRRLLIVSAGMLFEDAGVLASIVRTTVLRAVARDCRASEAIVTGSALDWTIVRPPRLTNGALTRAYHVADGHLPAGGGSLLARADVAHFLLDEVERAQHVRQIVGIS